MTAADLLPGTIDVNGALHLVSYGKSGGLGCFVADRPALLQRGTAVVIESMRGLEAGRVVGPATPRQARLLGPALAGRLVRPFTENDADGWQRQQQMADSLFHRARVLAVELQLPLELLDVEVLFDGSQAILQVLGQDGGQLDALAGSLQAAFALDIRFENLSQPTSAGSDPDNYGGCGKPDCGKASGGSCTTCSSHGGCSSCAKGSDVDLAVYFGHLRGKMDAHRERLSLL